MRNMRRRFAATLLLVVVALVLIAVAWQMKRAGLDRAAKISEIASLTVALAGLVTPAIPRFADMFRERRPPTPRQVREAREALAAGLSKGWVGEAEPHVFQTLPMLVRFAALSEDVASDTAGASSRFLESVPGKEDDFAHVRESFSREPRYRRVVLGGPGTGKTILITELAAQLLEAGENAEPLPLILPAASWDPEAESLRAWLAQQLARGYALPMWQARALASGGHVMPILDGLDEMPEHLRPFALARINEYRINWPLVVTSRPEQYFQAMDQDVGIHNAVPMELKPLQVADITDYLKSVGGSHWASVIRHLPTQAAEPLTQALSNPLMLWLATAVYAERNPVELTDGTLFASRPSIEQHLLDELVPTVYGASSQWSRPGFRCTVAQARRWLSFLAEQSSYALGDYLAWWEFRVTFLWRLLGIAMRGTVLFGVGAVMLVWILAAHGDWRHGAPSDSINYGNLLLAGPAGQRYVRPAVNQLAATIPRTDRHRIQVALNHFIQTFGHDHPQPLYWFLGIGLLVMLFLKLDPPLFLQPQRLQIRPIGMLARALGGAVLCALAVYVLAWLVFRSGSHSHHQAGALAAFVGAHWSGLVVVSMFGLIWIPSSFVVLADIVGPINPFQSLLLDRQAYIVTTVLRRSALATIIWLWSGIQLATAYAVFAATATLVTALGGGQARIVARDFASRHYTDAHIWLVCRRQLPWRAMAFLADAQRRGVLRQIGATYRFRHLRVQEQLSRSWSHLKGRRGRWQSRGEVFTDAVRELLGRHEETLSGFLDAVDRARSMAKTRPDMLPPGFAKQLRDLHFRLIVSAREDETLDGIIALNSIYQQLSQANPSEYTSRLTESLRILTWRLHSAGRSQDALQLAKWIVDGRRKLAGEDESGLTGLAESIVSLADMLDEYDRREEAIRMNREAIGVYRKLAALDPITYTPQLALALREVAERLLASERASEALGCSQEAVRMFCDLTRDRPEFLRHYEQALERLADIFRVLRRKDDELTTIRSAILVCKQHADRIDEIRRDITQLHLAPLLAPDTDSVFRNCGNDRSRSGNKVTLEAAQKAAAACRELAKSHFGTRPEIASAMYSIATRLKASGWLAEASIINSGARELPRRAELEAQAVGHWSDWYANPHWRMIKLATRMWKLGAHAEALEAGANAGISAPPIPPKIREGGVRPRLLARSPQPEASYIRQSIRVRLWRGRVRNARLFARRNQSNLRSYSARQGALAEAISDYGNYLDTLAFNLKAAGSAKDAQMIARQASNVRAEVANIYRELSGRYQDRYHVELATSLDMLAYQLRVAGDDQSAAEAAHEAQYVRRIFSTGNSARESGRADMSQNGEHDSDPLQD